MRYVGRWAFPVAALWLGASGGAQAADAPSAAPPSSSVAIPLDRAAERGLVEVRGSRPGSYQEVDLHLASRSTESVTLDLAGRYLRPRTGDVQRLGLSHPLTPVSAMPAAPAGTVVLTLAPGEKRTIRMHTCCMDAGKACPRPQDEYALATTPTPPKVEAALRWWVDHPQAPQGFVNAAIWQSDLSLLEGSWGRGRRDPGPSEQPAMPRGRSVRAYGGVLYLLDDGALTSLDPEGIRRFHATGVWEAWPGADGLLAVGMASGGRDLWRFGETGDPPWTRLFPVRVQPTRAVMRASGGGVLLHQGESAAGALWGRPARNGDPVEFAFSELDEAAPDSIQAALPDGALGRAVVVIRHKGTPRPGANTQANQLPRAPTIEVFDVDVATGKAAARRKFWNVRQLVPGPAGVFGVSPGNRLVRLEGERFIDLPFAADGLQVVLVGGKRVVVTTEAGHLVSVDARTGRGEVLPDGARAAAGRPAASLSVDAKTDQLVWLEGDSVRRWTPGHDEVETIPFR